LHNVISAKEANFEIRYYYWKITGKIHYLIAKLLLHIIHLRDNNRSI